MRPIRECGIETKAVHGGEYHDPLGAVIPPIYQTSTFRFRDVDHGARLFRGEEDGYIYTRMRNPTIEAMENAIAVLEGGWKALGCASGMAAVHTTLAVLMQGGGRIVCSESVYGATATLLMALGPSYGIETTFVDTSRTEEIERAIRQDTKVVFIETPANPTLVITDIAAAADIAHHANATLVVDNTFMSPVLQHPFALGADVVIHSMTKFLNGHADVVGGVIVVKTEEQYKAFRSSLNLLGGVIDPFNAFLVHRGLKTLPLRIERQCANAMRIAEYLERHPAVQWVRYPGLRSHPQYELNRRQSDGPGAMISFELKGGLPAGKALMNSVHLCALAVSLGGVESLIQHPASMTHATMARELREQAAITDGLVRLSVGIENVEDILGDLDQGLSKL
ncbi:MAG: aminotransferase class I/II-fold pyridoxal phosphate-dependent enzyme [Bacteroidota bacterium]|nr:aminotransferase class I/II-fold pyridoxal phosphate-dependent enzyme [Bacteroidota bacterium]